MTTDATVETARRDALTELYFAASRGRLYPARSFRGIEHKGITPGDTPPTNERIEAIRNQVLSAQSRPAVQELMERAHIDLDDLSDIEFSPATTRKILRDVDYVVRLYTLVPSPSVYDEFIVYMGAPAAQARKFLRLHGIGNIPLNWVFDNAKIQKFYENVEKVRTLALSKLTLIA